jgi:DNA-binding protein YbaB
MPSTKTEGSHPISKTDVSKQVQDQTPSESEAQTQKLVDHMEKNMATSPEKKTKKQVDKSKKMGEVTITFFGKRNFDVKVTGAVTFSQIQSCKRMLYKAVSINKADIRRANKAKVKAKIKEK